MHDFDHSEILAEVFTQEDDDQHSSICGSEDSSNCEYEESSQIEGDRVDAASRYALGLSGL